MGRECITRRRSTSISPPLLLGRGPLSALLCAGRGWWVAWTSYSLHSSYTQRRLLAAALVAYPGCVLSPHSSHTYRAPGQKGILATCQQSSFYSRKYSFIWLHLLTLLFFFFFFPSSHAISSFKLMSLWKQGFTTAFRSLYLLHKFPRTKSQGNQDSYIIKRSGAFLLR